MATRPHLVARGALLIGAALASLIPSPPAGAQAEEVGGARLQIIRQPVVHEPGDRLGIVIRITNTSDAELDDMRLQIRAFAALSSRSDLQAALEIGQERVELSSTSLHVAPSLTAGGATNVRVSPKLEELPSLTTAVSGIYPLTITVTDDAGFQVFGTVTTFLVYLPSEVESPLMVVPMWVIGELPARAPDGAFEPHPTLDRWHLEEAVGERGWLTSMLDGLMTSAGERLRLGIAPTPRLVEELADMADGYDRRDTDDLESVAPNSPIARAASDAIGGLSDLLQQPRAQPILTPYSFADIPTMTDDLERLQLQLHEAEGVLGDVLGVAPGRAWIFPPAGRLDTSSLADLHGLEAAASTFFGDDSLSSLDDPFAECAPPFSGGTFTCPVSVETLGGRSRGYLLDPQLQDRLDALGDDDGRVALQRVFAETAMIWAELPNDDDRIVPLVIPSALDLRPQAARLLIRTLARAPWMQTFTPRGGLHQGIGAATREAVGELRPTSAATDETFAATLDAATRALNEFEGIEPPADRLQRLTRTYLTAQSRSWGSDPLLIARGEEYARSVVSEIDDEFGKIRLGGRSDITLTSRAGELPLVLRNDTGYEVALELDLRWTDLDLEIEQAHVSQGFPPGASAVPIEVTARASGNIPVQVTISSPEGREIETKTIIIRSTEFNEIALAITLGALGFLIVFYLFRAFGRRKVTPA
jgi:hypothetical protein